MKIAITANTSWNIYNFRMGLVNAFLKKGYEVIAIAPEDEYTSQLIQAGCRFYPLQMQNKGSNPIRDISLIRQLYKIYKESGPDIVLQFTIKPNIYGTLAARTLHLPVINNVSGLGTVFIRDNIISRIAHLLYKISFGYAQQVFFQNKDDLQLFLDKNLIKKEKADILPGSGINIEKYVPSPFKRNNPFTFLLIARLLYDKGIIEYMEAIKYLKRSGSGAHFQLMGALDEESKMGIPLEDLQHWMEEKLIEYIPFNDKVISYIEKADCIVLPSYREGTPKSLLEAAAMSKPLIATDVPGCREVVEDGFNGFLCKVKSKKDLADKMHKINSLTDDELITMGQNSRKTVLLKFDEHIVVNFYLKAINRILSGRNQGKY